MENVPMDISRFQFRHFEKLTFLKNVETVTDTWLECVNMYIYIYIYIYIYVCMTLSNLPFTPKVPHRFEGL